MGSDLTFAHIPKPKSVDRNGLEYREHYRFVLDMLFDLDVTQVNGLPTEEMNAADIDLLRAEFMKVIKQLSSLERTLDIG